MRIAFFTTCNDEGGMHNLRLAELMIRSARKHMPDVEVVQMTDMQTARVQGVTECVRLEQTEPLMPFRLRHHANLEGEVLFVDTDVMFSADVRDVFAADFDVCLTERRDEVIFDAKSGENVAASMPFNTGVMFSRKRQFWQAAHARCLLLSEDEQRWYGDQLAVKHIVDSCAFHVTELPCATYNYTPERLGEDLSERKVLHFKGARKAWMMFDKFELIGGVEIPKYRTFSAVPNDDRGHNMAIAMRHGFEELQQIAFHEGELSIACYGPTLKRTWRELKQPIMSVSGAHDFLIERGIVPTYHIDCDPREYKAEWVKNSRPDVTYVMGSCQHPATWKYLVGRKVLLWHVYNGQETTRWLKKNAPDSFAICGGSTIGLRAIEVGGVLGFRKFAIHGMDSSIEGGERHAGPHNGEPQKTVRVKIGERWFVSSPQMIEAAREAMNVVARYAPIGIVFTFYGDGLMQTMIRSSIEGSNDFKVAA